MAFQFRMIFSGLSVLVPDREFSGSVEAAERASMLLPNLTHSKVLSDGSILDAHFPILKFKLSQRRRSSTRRIDLQDQTHGVCLLHGEEIDILPVARRATSFRMLTRKPGDLLAPSEEERRSLFWLATMEQAAPGNGRLKRGLAESRLDSESMITARVQLDQGRLVTESLSEHLCRFEPPGQDPFERRIAVALALEIDRVPQSVVLSMAKEGEEPRTLVLAPAAGEEVVTVEVQNREADELLKITQPKIDRTQADFEVFFDLLAESSRQARRFPREVVPSDVTEFPPHAMCPPTAANVSS